MHDSSTLLDNTQGRSLTRWGQLSVHTWIKLGILAILFFWLYKTEISGVVGIWNSDGSWSHGYLIPFFSLYFVNQKKSELLNLSYKRNYLGLILLIGVILFYPLNKVHFQYGYFSKLNVIAAMGAIVLFLGGWRLVKRVWLAVVFLLFAVPIPQRYYVEITMPMRKLASVVATAILNWVPDIQATASGVVIDIIYKGEPFTPALNVAEACSGMRLLMAFCALGVAMAYLHYRPAWQRIVLLASTVPIAILCNMVRVTTTGLIYVLIDPKYAQGPWHDGLGFAMLPLAFGLYAGLSWFMSNLFEDEVQERKPDVIIRSAKREEE